MLRERELLHPELYNLLETSATLFNEDNATILIFRILSHYALKEHKALSKLKN